MEPQVKEEEAHNMPEGDVRTEEGGTCCSRLWKRAFPTGYCPEFKGTMRLAWALVLVQTSQFAFNTVATMFGGHLGKLELDAIALSNTLINILGTSLIIGFSSCLDTVLSQSFGMGNYKLVGIYLQRGIILHMLLLLACFAIHMNIKPILLLLGQDAEVVELTSQYMLYFMPGMLFMFMWTVLRKFTQCQNLVNPHILITLFGHLVHALLQYLFLYQFGFGITGSAVAQAITYFVMFVLTLIYTRFSKAYKQCWGGWDVRCLLDWGPLASLAVYGMLMVCMEWWAFEATVIMAGVIGPTELGAQSITFNLDGIFFGVPSGIAVATSIRVGQFLGAAQKGNAVTAAKVGMSIGAMNALVWAIITITARTELPKLFTNDLDVIQLTSELLPFVAIYTLGDALSTVGRGVLRGTGKQKWATIIIIIAYYIVALPIAIPLTFLTSLSIKGLWIAFPVALSITGIIYFCLVNFFLDWDKAEKEALARAQGKADLKEHSHEQTPLLGYTKSFSDKVIIPTSVYVKRIITVLFFVLIPIAGLVIRLTTQTGQDSLMHSGTNSTVPGVNSTAGALSTVSYSYSTQH